MRANPIVIVDPDPDCRAFYRAILEHARYGAIATARAEDAMNLALACRPDLIIAEFPLPLRPHASFTTAVRASAELSDTPLLVVTKGVFPHDCLAALAAGADGVLAKPVEPAALLHEVERVRLSGSRRWQQAVSRTA